MTVREAQQKITSVEFVEWITFLDHMEKQTTKEDVYHAGIMAEVRRTIAKNPSDVKLKHFILDFENAGSKKEAPKTKKEAAKKSKAFFGPMFGIKTPLKKAAN